MQLATLFARPQSTAAERDAELELPDGRRLSYATFGDADGPVVVVLDGPGSRGLARAAAASAAELGLRLVAPDRPGFGSTTQPRRYEILDWPRDHAALLDALGVQRAGIVGQSGGTPYALAAAAALPDRTTALALVAPVGPLSEPAMRASSGAQLRRGVLLGRRAPWLLRLLLAAAGRQARKDPEGAAAKIAGDLPPADAAIMRDPSNWAMHQRTTAEILGRPGAMAREIARLTRPWGIDYDPIDMPVALWSGDRDDVHPTAHARRLAELLGGAPVHVVAGAGTFGLMPRYGDALRFAAGRAG
ncbi:MAG TPA: alpha/beta hydrolase [Solirubrobacteraceae bacterium]|nr:alpha/beta hydrolase [Solirubrobacteraceae bacterium]